MADQVQPGMTGASIIDRNMKTMMPVVFQYAAEFREIRHRGFLCDFKHNLFWSYMDLINGARVIASINRGSASTWGLTFKKSNSVCCMAA